MHEIINDPHNGISDEMDTYFCIVLGMSMNFRVLDPHGNRSFAKGMRYGSTYTTPIDTAEHVFVLRFCMTWYGNWNLVSNNAAFFVHQLAKCGAEWWKYTSPD